MDSTPLRQYIDEITMDSAPSVQYIDEITTLTTGIPKNITGMHHHMDKILSCHQNNTQFYVQFYVIYSKICMDYFTKCEAKECMSTTKLKKINDIDYESLDALKSMDNKFEVIATDIKRQKIKEIFDVVILPFDGVGEIKLDSKLNSLIYKYIVGELKNKFFDQIPIVIRNAVDKLMNINRSNPQPDIESLATKKKHWLDCAVYSDMMMRYEWYTDKCYPDEKQMVLPSNRCGKNMLYLYPLHKLIIKFFNFRQRKDDVNISAYPNTPNLHAPGRIKNKEIEVFDLFIVSGCLRQLFDMIEEVVNVDVALINNYDYIDRAITKFATHPDRPILSNFFVNPNNRKYHRDLFEILILIYESNRAIQCYHPYDQQNLPLYIVGDYIAHRIKRIDYAKFDRMGSFREFYQFDVKKAEDKNITLTLNSYFITGILDYINIPFKWNGIYRDFRNCVETTVLNLITIMYGDSKTGNIKIPDNSPKKIKDFFEQYNLADDDTMDLQPNAKLIEWSMLLMNQENILYETNVEEEKTIPTTIKGWAVQTNSIVNLLKQLVGYAERVDTLVELRTKTIAQVRGDMIDFIKSITPTNPIDISLDRNGRTILINNIYGLDITDGHSVISGISSYKYDLSVDVAFYDIVKNASINIGYTFATTDGLYIGRVNKRDIMQTDSSHSIYIGSKCFYEEKFSITTINLPSTTIYIGDRSFYNTNIQKINLPDSVREIGTESFAICYSMKQFNINSTSRLEKIGPQGFMQCTALTEFNLSDSVREIGNKSFYGCYMMNKFTVNVTNSRLKKIGDNMFELCMRLTSFNLPDSVLEIGSRSFYECTGMIQFNINDISKLEKIGNNAFQNCGKLIAFNLPDSVLEIGDHSFTECAHMTHFNVNVTNSRLKKIGNEAFLKCSKLIIFNLPNNVQEMGVKAFYECKSMLTFNIDIKNSKLKYIGSEAFVKTAIQTINIPSSVKDIIDSFDDTIRLNVDRSIETLPDRYRVNAQMMGDAQPMDHLMLRGGSGKVYWVDRVFANKNNYLKLC